LSFFVKKLFSTSKNSATVAQKALFGHQQINTYYFKLAQNREERIIIIISTSMPHSRHTHHPTHPVVPFTKGEAIPGRNRTTEKHRSIKTA
jgi:hypothetical protein